MILLRELQEHLDDLLSAIRRLVVESLEQQLQELLLRLTIDLLLVLIHLFLVLLQDGLDDVAQDFDERLAKNVRITIEEAKELANVQVQRFGCLLREFGQELGNISEARVESDLLVVNLLREILYDCMRQLVVLALCDDAYEF